MNWFIIISLFFIWNFQECHCCLKWKWSADYCECSDITDILWKSYGTDEYDILISEKGGCVKNITCHDSVLTYVTTNFSTSEIVRPDDSHKDTKAYVDSCEIYTGIRKGSIDVFSFFGMTCENNKWYVTKYPFGVHYITKDSETKFITEGLDGKRSEIESVSCRPVEPPCKCSDITDILWKSYGTDEYDILISEKGGCVKNITCHDSVLTYVTTNFSTSEIVRPDDSHKDTKAYVDSCEIYTGIRKGSIDVFSFFGMTCENNKWYVTKYPFGVHYITKDSETKFITEGLDGKRSEIESVSCRPVEPP
ncbi:hypothetical protein CRE_21422 [Caenorhabditis remanei]|uniref:DUF281 domain-containing protein n=1 Tax=Caenorhabditis remanei TaxID=31234 RepID=E3MUV5_CAERE|nr:hypothetical protein CRE_21422 [Caenorhabditis remanei]